MRLRRVVIFLVVMCLISSAFVIQPSIAKINRPVEVWPTNGWAINTPESQGMNSTHLSEIYSRVRTSGANICSMLVVRHGYLVAEEYFKPEVFDVNQTHSIYSVTKSIVSCLIGIALNLGIIRSINQNHLDFFPFFSGNLYGF